MEESLENSKMRVNWLSCQIMKNNDHIKYKLILLTLWVNITVRYGIIGKF